MKFASAHSTITDLAEAVERACAEILKTLDGVPADLAMVFVTGKSQDDLGLEIRKHLGSQVTVLGTTAEGVIGTGVEFESKPALSLWAASLPGVQLLPFHVTFSRTPDGIAQTGLPAAEATDFTPSAAFVFGDPFTTATDSLIEIWEEEFPGMPIMGGMASAGSEPGENRLYWNDETFDEGAVGLFIGGAVRVRPIVSQGCRPVGWPLVVTKAQGNFLLELGGKPATEKLGEVFHELSGNDQRLFQSGPFVGLALNEYQSEFKRGDFLISSLVGIDPKYAVIAIGNAARIGQTIQFHVRDANTADEDLRVLLQGAIDDGPTPQGALVFSCNGRGTRMFPGPHHDAGVLRELAGPIASAGLFAAGELGPVTGRNYMHGFTASIALFCDPDNTP